MSEQWQGLHNPQWHETTRRIRESQIEDIIALRYDLEVAREAQATIDALKAQVQRVRAACEHQRCYGEYGPDAEVVAAVPVHVLLHALDGGDE